MEVTFDQVGGGWTFTITIPDEKRGRVKWEARRAKPEGRRVRRHRMKVTFHQAGEERTSTITIPDEKRDRFAVGGDLVGKVVVYGLVFLAMVLTPFVRAYWWGRLKVRKLWRAHRGIGTDDHTETGDDRGGEEQWTRHHSK